MDNGFEIKTDQKIRWGEFTAFKKQGIMAAVSLREGGESDINPGSLDLALHVGDDPEKVVCNRALFAAALGCDADLFTTCQQVHGSKIALVDKKLAGSGAKDFSDTVPSCDGLITNLPRVPLLLFFADCVPVLLADPVKRAVGLVHGGWRGTAARIAAKGVAMMREKFGSDPKDILAGIGPSIGPCCYEVDDTVKDAMAGLDSCFKAKGGGKYDLDLWQANCLQLLGAGLKEENITVSGLCTADNTDLFFSYRSENGKCGRMGACIFLQN